MEPLLSSNGSIDIVQVAYLVFAWISDRIFLKSYDHLTTNNRPRNIINSDDLLVAMRLIERMKTN